MTRSPSQLQHLAARLAGIGGILGIVAGVVQATIGSRIPDWSGNKGSPVALGLLTIALGATVVVAARTLRATTAPRAEMLTAITLWLAAIAALCSTTVGRLWTIPGMFLVAAAGVTLAACGWQRFRSVGATNWLCGLLGFLGALVLLMAVSAASVTTVVSGIIAGGALIAAALTSMASRRTRVIVLVAATLPFAALTWWTVVTPLITVVALAIGFATTGKASASGRIVSGTATATSASPDRLPVG
jgi:hypothetical protein